MFSPDPRGSQGVNAYCKPCRAALSKAEYHANKEKHRARKDKAIKENPRRQKGYYLKNRFNISMKEWETIFNNQGKVCAICKIDKPSGMGWHTDHDHETNKVRGILCMNCNMALGLFKDKVEFLASAVLYLSKIDR